MASDSNSTDAFRSNETPTNAYFVLLCLATRTPPFWFDRYEVRPRNALPRGLCLLNHNRQGLCLLNHNRQGLAKTGRASRVTIQGRALDRATSIMFCQRRPSLHRTSTDFRNSPPLVWALFDFGPLTLPLPHAASRRSESSGLTTRWFGSNKQCV